MRQTRDKVLWMPTREQVIARALTATLCAAVLLTACSRTPEPEGRPPYITEAEARRLAAEHVNSKLAGHVWQTPLGERKFAPMAPRHWHAVALQGGRLVLRCGGSRGPEYTVSMKPDGSDVRLDSHGYATR